MLGLMPLPLLSLGSTPSDPPVLVSVTDNGDQDAATATVTGAGTIQLYYRVRATSIWIAGNTRSGDGTIVQTGLTANTWYDFYATADQNGIESGGSNLITTFIAGESVSSIERALFAILSGDGDVSGLVDDRIYPLYVPQNAPMPAITLQQITGPRDNTFDGPSGLVKAIFHIKCRATTYKVCDQLAVAVDGALSGFSGTVGGLKIDSALFDDEADIPAITPGVDGLRRMGKRLDFRIWFQES